MYVIWVHYGYNTLTQTVRYKCWLQNATAKKCFYETLSGVQVWKSASISFLSFSFHQSCKKKNDQTETFLKMRSLGVTRLKKPRSNALSSYLYGASATAFVNMVSRSAKSCSVSHMRTRHLGFLICKSTSASSTSTLDTMTLGPDSLLDFSRLLPLTFSLSDELEPRTALRNWRFSVSLTSLQRRQSC